LFVGLEIDEKVWNATTDTKNRDRLLGERVALIFFEATVKKAKKKRFLSDEHFTVDGTHIESYSEPQELSPKVEVRRGSGRLPREEAQERHA
jgi:hypothetical protein